MTRTLTINGESRSLAGWGIDDQSVTLRRSSFDADLLTFALTVADVLAEPPFEYGDAVEYFENGVRRFSGWIREERFDGSAEEEVQSFVAKNAWHELEVIAFDQERNTKSADDDWTANIRQRTTQVLLGWDIDAGKINTRNQMVELLDFAIEQGGLAIQHDVDFSGLLPPYEERKDITVATGMRAMASLTPDSVSWFDYTTTPPTIFIRRRPTETPLTVDLTGGAPLVSFRALKALHDLVPSGVDITFVSEVINPADSQRYVQLDRYEAVVAAARARLLRTTIQLKGAQSAEPEATPEALAAAYYAALQELFYETSLTFVGSAVLYRPGNLLNFTNGRAAWATAKAIVQSVTETPAKDLMIVECGRPQFLTSGTWAEISRRFNGDQDSGLLGSFVSGTTVAPPPPTDNTAYKVPQNLQCESKSGSATLIGFSEWSSPSVPPKKYLVLTSAGTNVSNRFTDGSCSTPDSPSTISCTHAGTRTYNAETGAFVDAGGFTCSNGSSGGVAVDVAPSCDTAVSSTPTVKSLECTTECCSAPGGASIRCASAGLTLTLSNEDTEENAVARAGGTHTPGAGFSGCESGPAFRSVRGAGQFSFSWREKRVRAAWSADPTRTYTLTFTFGRRAIGSTGAYVAISSEVLVVLADEANEVSPWVTVPNAAGFETECIGLTGTLEPIP